MRKWKLNYTDPLCLTLATDARLEPTDYYNDQIWELRLEGGTPPALSVYTTYGLRARSLRMFPCFSEGETYIIDPTDFTKAVVIEQIHPNFIQVGFAPLPELDVQAAYWVPQSQAITGRLWINNNSKIKRQIQFEWIGQLSAIEGERMAAVEIQAATVLSGKTSELAPVIFLTGGPSASPGSYPGLRVTVDLEPGETRLFTWVHAALANKDDSFALARAIANQQWEAEHSRLEMANASMLEIYTGNQDWDTTFMLAQKAAFNLFVGPTSSLPYASFVQNRLPDQGYTLRGDGSDYNHLWNGQSPLESYYLASIILPTAPKLAQGLIYNFVSVQDENGSIDWKPGLGSQRSQLLATPLLATLTWKIFEACEDTSFLQNTFSSLYKFLLSWFSHNHDRDDDGVPEWDHPLQFSAEDHPVFSFWHENSQGVDITTFENPALCSFLYQECQSLINIATQIRQTEPIPELREIADKLRNAVEESWDDRSNSYKYRDRDTHDSLDAELLAQNIGPGMILVNRVFEKPLRLMIRLNTSQETKPHLQIIVHGNNASGLHRVEKITVDQFRWYPGRGVFTGQNIYASIEQIDIQGLDTGDEIAISSVDTNFRDDSVLMPLWAKIPDHDRAIQLIEQTITNPDLFWRPYGLLTCPDYLEQSEPAFCNNVNLIWNQFIGEGLVAYGYRKQAADLINANMEAIIANLKHSKAFRRYYDSENGNGRGELNALSGLPSLGLFLETLGVRLISAHKVAISGFNPFPWPVTVKYRGMTIVRQREKTLVVFPDGQTVNIEDTQPRIVSLE